MALNDVWDWNLTTGDSFVPLDQSPNSRFCLTPAELSNVAGNRDKEGIEHTTRIYDFMTSNRTQLTTQFNAKYNQELRGFLRLLRAVNFKKNHVEYIRGGTVVMQKLRSDAAFNGEPDWEANRIRNGHNNSTYGLVDDINHNSMLGYVGPGTFPCFKPTCVLCPLVGSSRTVNLGPHGQLQLTKRASCVTRNAVYVGICQQCEQENNFAAYFGETTVALKQRCNHHKSRSCNAISVLRDEARFPTVHHQRDEIRRVIATRTDPEGILRDWFAHITPGGIHPGMQRMSVVDIQPHHFRRRNRERNLVEAHMFLNNDFDYRGMGIGCLNVYGDDYV